MIVLGQECRDVARLARAISKCSVETYSSFISRARAAAVLITASSGRDVSGALSVCPLARGSRPSRFSASLATTAGSAPTARSSGAAVLLVLRDQGNEQMQRVNLGARIRRSPPDGGRQRILALAGQLVIHRILRLTSLRALSAPWWTGPRPLYAHLRVPQRPAASPAARVARPDARCIRTTAAASD